MHRQCFSTELGMMHRGSLPSFLRSVIFFFKQKTAYEMRISDWSSDVCSSDLKGAPAPSGHGTAVASLIVGDGKVKGAAPGAPLLVADIYGLDPAGGSAIAIARALGWMAANGVRIVTISLVGPDNPLLAGAVSAARRKGLILVAAVGNDGPAAPPAFPASYDGVVAVTGVDGRNRALIEAGRALHLDYSAPRSAEHTSELQSL